MSEAATVALTGLAGVVIGSIATVVGSIAMHLIKKGGEARREKPAKALLKEMLNHKHYTWRKLDTLAHVIGADKEKTKQLLLEIGARASEDGQSLWALKSKAPLSSGDN